MLEVFLETLQQVGILLAFILLGYFLRKKKIVGAECAKMLAVLETLLFIPANTFEAFSLTITVSNITEYLSLLLYGCAFLVASILLAIGISHLLTKDKAKQGVYKYVFTFTNSGYFGVPVVLAVFGMAMRAKFGFFALPFSIAIYSYGMYVLTKDYDMAKENLEKELDRKEIRKNRLRKLSFLYSPVMLSTYLGIAVGLLPFEMPKVINTAVGMASSCMSSVAMLLTGITLASLPLKKLFCSLLPYLVGVIRLIIIPAVFCGISYLIGLRGEALVLSAAYFALPVGMNVVIFPESVGKDSSFGASICFISYIMALVTLPLVFGIIQLIA